MKKITPKENPALRRVVLWLEIYKQLDLIARFNSSNTKRLCNIAVQQYIVEQIHLIRRTNTEAISELSLKDRNFSTEDINMLRSWGLEIEDK